MRQYRSVFKSDVQPLWELLIGGVGLCSDPRELPRFSGEQSAKQTSRKLERGNP